MSSKKTDSRQAWGLFYHLPGESFRDYRTDILEIRVVTVNDHRTAPRNISDGYTEWDNAHSDLRISAYLSVDAAGKIAPKGAWGFDVTYRDVYSADWRRADAMAKTLKKVHTRLQKVSEEDMHPATFGQYVLRVGRILGLEGVIFFRDKIPGSYDNSTYHFLSLRDGAERIDGMIRLGAESDGPGASVFTPGAC